MRVFITLEEKGVHDYVFQEIDMATGEHKVRVILPLLQLHIAGSAVECV